MSMDENLGAGNEARTRDLNLGKVALYQLSYSRRSHYILRFSSCLHCTCQSAVVLILLNQDEA